MTNEGPVRIAMWSGPRNISTAMMRSFENRSDCAVWDEPFYAAYLQATRDDHPMREAVIATGEADPAKVIARCTGPVPDGKAHFYQKHMCHHMIDGIDRDWIAGLTNVFLIRHPARVLASYAAKRQNPSLSDIGFAAQRALHALVARLSGQAPVVIDSATIRQDPGAALAALCGRIGLDYTASMLHWPAGPKPYDGAWAPHWYGAVRDSTGFAGAEGPLPDVAPEQRETFRAAMEIYEDLSADAIEV